MDDPRPPHQQARDVDAPAQDSDYHAADEFFGGYPALSVLSLSLLWILGYQLGISFLGEKMDSVYLPILLSAGVFHLLNPWLFLRRQATPLLESLRIGLPRGSQVFWLTLLTLCLLPTIELLTQFNTQLVPVPEGFEEFLEGIIPHSGADWALACTALVLIAPLGEEVVFRGFMQQAARASIGPLRASVGIGVFFSLIHLQPHHVIPLAFLGIALCLVFERTGNLLASVWIHALYNGVGLLMAATLGDMEPEIPSPLLAGTAAISLGLAALAYSQLRNEQPWTLDREEEKPAE